MNERGLFEVPLMVPNALEFQTALGLEKRVWLRVLKASTSMVKCISFQTGMLRRRELSRFHCEGLRRLKAPVRGALPMRLSRATPAVWLTLTGFWKAAVLK